MAIVVLEVLDQEPAGTFLRICTELGPFDNSQKAIQTTKTKGDSTKKYVIGNLGKTFQLKPKTTVNIEFLETKKKETSKGTKEKTA